MLGLRAPPYHRPLPRATKPHDRRGGRAYPGVMLNRIWAFFFLAAFATACVQSLFLGHPEVWQTIVASTFETAKTAFEISLGLTGVLCLWLGIMRIGERGGAVELLGRAFAPLL